MLGSTATTSPPCRRRRAVLVYGYKVVGANAAVGDVARAGNPNCAICHDDLSPVICPQRAEYGHEIAGSHVVVVIDVTIRVVGGSSVVLALDEHDIADAELGLNAGNARHAHEQRGHDGLGKGRRRVGVDDRAWPATRCEQLQLCDELRFGMDDALFVAKFGGRLGQGIVCRAAR